MRDSVSEIEWKAIDETSNVGRWLPHMPVNIHCTRLKRGEPEGRVRLVLCVVVKRSLTKKGTRLEGFETPEVGWGVPSRGTTCAKAPPPREESEETIRPS